jgi:PAS domain S-box-containing protein
MNIDMTDFKHVEEELRSSQERFALSVEGSNDGIWDWDLRTNMSYESPRWFDMLGYSPRELEHGKDMDLILSLIHPEDRERFIRGNEEYLSKKTSSYEMEFRLRHKDGGYRWILSRGKALWDEHGKPYRMAGSHTDITERKRSEQVQTASREIAEAALTQNLDEFYRSVYAIITPLIPAKNFYITLYDAASDTFSTPFLVDEFDTVWPAYRPGKGLGAYVLRTGKPLLTTPESFAEMERQGLVEILDHPMVEWLGVPLKTREGRIIGVMAAQNYSGQTRLGLADIDLMVFVSVQVAMAIERKQAEEALRKSEALYRQAIEVANAVPYHQSYHVHGNSVDYDFIGEGIRKITGYGPEEFNEPLWDTLALERVLLEDLAEYEFDDAVMLVRSGSHPVWKCNHRIRARDGSIHWVFEAAVELRDPNGVSHGSIGLFQDITERKRAEEEREKLIQELTAKNAELERFTYTVSHDLKAPLVTINGFLGFLEKDFASGNLERLKKDNQRIREAVDKMQQLLSDLLELSRIGRQVNPSQQVEFRDLVREAVAIVQGRLDASRARVVIQPDLPRVYGDRQRLVEVLQNLIDNAAKFMGDQPEPVIEIGCRKVDGIPVFFVRDNGIGIDPRFHDQVFGLFNKLDPRVDGTGVGLALVKRIVELHDGRIWVESEMGKGAEFCFTLGSVSG